MQSILIISENVNLINLLQSDKERLSFVISDSQISLPKVKSFLLKNCCLVILNMHMTEEKSFALLHEIRKIHDVPILIVSTSTDVLNLVCAIRMGADDYLISPFEDSELMVRVHSLIRRYTVLNSNYAQTELLQSRDILIDIPKRSVCVKDKHISLTPKEFDILCFFAENRGKVFSKEQIYTNVWGAEYAVDDGNITSHIRRVRKKIEPNPSNPIYIKTVWDVGYRFCES